MLRFKYLYEKVQKEKREKDLAALKENGEAARTEGSEASSGQNENQIDSAEAASMEGQHDNNADDDDSGGEGNNEEGVSDSQSDVSAS